MTCPCSNHVPPRQGTACSLDLSLASLMVYHALLLMSQSPEYTLERVHACVHNTIDLLHMRRVGTDIFISAHQVLT